MQRKRVYISGPITRGNRNHNVYQAQEAQRLLMEAGFAPLNPMQTCVLPFAWQPEYTHATWIACDLPWVECAHAVLRLPGESDGADLEVAHAMRCGIPVFYSLQQLVEEMENQCQPLPAKPACDKATCQRV